MSASRFLDYEVALLLAKYGKNAVLNSLAKKFEMTAEQLEAILETRLAEKAVLRSPKRLPLMDVASQLTQEHPERAQSLRTLCARLESRTFLPELRDIRRFFEDHGRAVGAAKSRGGSLPQVVRLLAELEATELEELCRVEPTVANSSLGLISDEILGRNR